jgi:motility quorum-sensing regulator/GCU-specific mRNA interferase toxin
MSEKRRPTYDLAAFKEAFNAVDKLHVTGSALRGAASLGFGRREIVRDDSANGTRAVL